jgi:hypothetical protein
LSIPARAAAVRTTSHEYFALPTTQVPPFDVSTPYPTEIGAVKFDNYASLRP